MIKNLRGCTAFIKIKPVSLRLSDGFSVKKMTIPYRVNNSAFLTVYTKTSIFTFSNSVKNITKTMVDRICSIIEEVVVKVDLKISKNRISRAIVTRISYKSIVRTAVEGKVT
jgi:hypothetical protein